MKKVLRFIVIAAITLGMATGCEKNGPEKNVFLETEVGITFSMTYEDFFASFNSRVESVSKVGEVDCQDPWRPLSTIVYNYPAAEGAIASTLLVHVYITTKNVYSLEHDLWLDLSDETEHQQWVERIRALILSIDLDMDEMGCEKLMEELGVFDCSDLEDGYLKSNFLHGIRYTLRYDLYAQKDGGGRVEFSCATYRN